MNFAASKTRENLLAAFSGESMARNKYLFFADRARQEGHPEVAALFETMAKNEGVHGRLFYEKAVGIGATGANLQEAIKGEYGEWTSMYPDFARVAREEGFEDIAALFEGVAKVEKDHEYQFMATLARLQSGQQQKAAAPAAPEAPRTVQAEGYRCMFCGAIYDKRPDVCGLCHAIGSFEPVTYQKRV